jgi:hypothetical protein
VKNSDRELVKQMIKAGRNDALLDFMPAVIAADSKEMIEKMGSKWVCHPDNCIKRLDVPLLILNEPKTKVLKKK